MNKNSVQRNSFEFKLISLGIKLTNEIFLLAYSGRIADEPDFKKIVELASQWNEIFIETFKEEDSDV